MTKYWKEINGNNKKIEGLWFFYSVVYYYYFFFVGSSATGRRCWWEIVATNDAQVRMMRAGHFRSTLRGATCVRLCHCITMSAPLYRFSDLRLFFSHLEISSIDPLKYLCLFKKKYIQWNLLICLNLSICFNYGSIIFV